MVKIIVPMIVLSLGLAAGKASAVGYSEILDPAGDYFETPNCAGLICEPYQDIVRASITDDGSDLHLQLDLANNPPVAPAMPEAVDRLAWAWRFDFDPFTSPSGGPSLPPGVESPFEMFVGVYWDGAGYFGQIVDRRPLLNKQPAIVTTIPATISGNSVSVDVALAGLNVPLQFSWRSATNVYLTSAPSQGQYPVDTTRFATMQRQP